MKKKISWTWTGTITILCAVGLFSEMHPSGPFLVDYAVDFKNFTPDEMTHDVLPSTSIAYTGSVAFLLFVTDLLAYKPIIILGQLCTVIAWAFTIWYYDNIYKAKIRQVAYGISVVTTELAYFTYMYANVDKKDYRKVTSYVHSAVHVGQFISGLTGQLLLSLDVLELDKMNYLSLSGAISGLLLTFFIPRVLKDVVEKVNSSAQETSESTSDGGEVKSTSVIHYDKIGFRPKDVIYKSLNAYSIAKKNFLYAYTNVAIIKWSIWWTLSFAMEIQINLYVESIWKDIEEESHQRVYNGAVHCTHALISAILGIVIGSVKVKWIKWAGIVFGAGSVIQGLALYFLSQTDDLYIAYGCFGIFETVYQVLIIITKSEIAEEIRENSAAFIFGLNSLAACIIQLILTIIITGSYGFKLHIRDQFVVCATYSFSLGILYIIHGFPCWRRDSWNIHKKSEQSESDTQTAVEHPIESLSKFKM